MFILPINPVAPAGPTLNYNSFQAWYLKKIYIYIILRTSINWVTFYLTLYSLTKFILWIAWFFGVKWPDLNIGFLFFSMAMTGEFHDQRSLAGHSPWGFIESDTTEWLTYTRIAMTQFTVSPKNALIKGRNTPILDLNK